jgi:hypothetical protein
MESDISMRYKSTETVKGKAVRMLQVIYEQTRGKEEPIFVEEF